MYSMSGQTIWTALFVKRCRRIWEEDQLLRWDRWWMHLEKREEISVEHSHADRLATQYIVRSTRTRSSVPLLEPGSPRSFGGMQKRINHSRVAIKHKTNWVSTQPRRMIDASRVYFQQLNAYKTGHPYRLSVAQKTGLGLTDFPKHLER
jgi:hypothetical protein